MDNIKLGKIGEDTAVDILRAKGFQILQRNYRCRMGEVDIIAVKGGLMSFIEVKTRQDMSYGRPCESVGKDKQRHIKNAAVYYLREMERRGYVPAKISFDVMEIVVGHIVNAF